MADTINPIPTVSMACFTPHSAAHQFTADIEALLVGLRDAAPILHERLEPLAEQAWLRDANAIVNACAVILDRMPCLLSVAGACHDNRPVEPGDHDGAVWHRIDAMVTEIACLVPRLDEPGHWGTKVIAMLRQRIRWNLELLYGWRRMPEVSDPEEKSEAPLPPAVSPRARREVMWLDSDSH